MKALTPGKAIRNKIKELEAQNAKISKLLRLIGDDNMTMSVLLQIQGIPLILNIKTITYLYDCLGQIREHNERFITSLLAELPASPTAGPFEKTEDVKEELKKSGFDTDYKRVSPPVCKNCGKPVYFNTTSELWFHYSEIGINERGYGYCRDMHDDGKLLWAEPVKDQVDDIGPGVMYHCEDCGFNWATELKECPNCNSTKISNLYARKD